MPERRMVLHADHGYKIYEGRIGTVVRRFEVPNHGTKIVLRFPEGKLWDYETFERFTEEA